MLQFVITSFVVFSESNSTVSILTFVPMAEDHDRILVCRAENPRIPEAVLEDKWRLNVHYVPNVTLKLGSILDPNSIKEGVDVYFECNVQANPKSYRLTWFKGTKEIHHNASAGIILSDQSLVLQNVSRSEAGDYSCHAFNSEGSATSNPVSLQIRYAPSCKNMNDTGVYGALKHETVQLRCSVDSSPPPTSFNWIFNSSGEQTQIPVNLFTTSGFTSTLRFTPSSDMDFGTVLCVASNFVGNQEVPCLYKLVAAGHPMPLQNCTVLNHSAAVLHVACDPGFDGGLPQKFFLEVYELPKSIIRANLSSNETPTFEVPGLDTRRSYLLILYAANAKGRSELISLYTIALRSPDKYTGMSTQLPLSPMLASLLAVVALLCTGVCGVITALYRRHTARRLDRDKQPPTAAIYIDQSVDSLSKQDHLSTYCSSPKVDYCSQYELKMDGEIEETDPDIIPCNYDKKSLAELSNLMTPATDLDPSRIFCERPFGFPTSASSSNISVVNRGVCARSSDIAAARHLPSTNVRESCI